MPISGFLKFFIRVQLYMKFATRKYKVSSSYLLVFTATWYPVRKSLREDPTTARKFTNGDENCFRESEESGGEFDSFIIKWKVRNCVFRECVCILFYFCNSFTFILGVTWRQNPSRPCSTFYIAIQLWQMKERVKIEQAVVKIRSLCT